MPNNVPFPFNMQANHDPSLIGYVLEFRKQLNAHKDKNHVGFRLLAQAKAGMWSYLEETLKNHEIDSRYIFEGKYAILEVIQECINHRKWDIIRKIIEKILGDCLDDSTLTRSHHLDMLNSPDARGIIVTFAQEHKWGLVHVLMQIPGFTGYNSKSSDNETILWLCIEGKRTQLAQTLLRKSDIDVNTVPDCILEKPSSILLLCAIKNQWIVLNQLLLRNDIDINIIQNGGEYSGDTLLKICAYRQEWMLFAMLLTHPKIIIRESIEDCEYNSELIDCATHGNWGMLELALKTHEQEYKKKIV